MQAEPAQQLATDTRVFTRHGVDQTQHVQGTQGEVGHVADGSGHHVERGRRILLAGCGLSHGVDQQFGPGDRGVDGGLGRHGSWQ